MKFLIRGNPQDPVIKAMKAEETAQALKAQEQAQARLTRHLRQAIRNEARRQAREQAEAEAEATPRPTEQQATSLKFIKAYYGGEAPNEADLINYIRKQAERPKAEYYEAVRPIGSKSLYVLCINGLLFRKGQNGQFLPVEATTHKEQAVLKGVRRFKEDLFVKVRKGQYLKLTEAKQTVLTTGQARTPRAAKFINTTKGSPERPENNLKNQIGKTRPILSYFNIGYEENEAIYIGEEQEVKNIIAEYKSRNNPTGQYYDFIEDKADKTSRSRTTTTEEARPVFRTIKYENRKEQEVNSFISLYSMFREEIAEKPTQEQFDLINTALFKKVEVLEVKTKFKTERRGINNLTETEKEAINKTGTGGEARKETEARAKELLEIAEAQDGRQTIFNIEYDLRTEAEVKALRAETSTVLYFLIQEVEEQAELIEIKAKGKVIGHKHTKKATALLNTLKGLKDTAERREEIQESIEEQQAEADRRSTNKANKKGKNRYNTKTGIQAPNRKPTGQEMKIRKTLKHLIEKGSQKAREQAERTEENKKLKLKVLSSIQSINEVQEEREARERAEAEAGREAREKAEAEAQRIARENNTREIKALRKLKEPTEEEKAQIVFRNQDLYYLMYQIEERAEQGRRRTERKNLKEQAMKDYLKFYYGEKQAEEEAKTLIKDHQQDFKFIKAINL